MRRLLLIAILATAALAPGCGGPFKLPTENRVKAPPPSDKSYEMVQTWNGMDGIKDILLIPPPGLELFFLFNHGGSGGPSVPRGEVKRYPFSQPIPIGSSAFAPLQTLFNPIALCSAVNSIFVLDEGDSCMAKFDPNRGTCEADPQRNGQPNIILDYTATWRVREYPLTGGDTLSTFTDTTLAWVSGVAADHLGNVYVSGIAIVLDTLTTDQRIRTRKFVSRVYRYARGPKYPPNGYDIRMPGANWHRDTTWYVHDGSGSSSVVDPRGIDWSPLSGGALFVADRGNNKAKLVGTSVPNDGLVALDGSETPTGTSFSAPQGVAVDDGGFLYVVDRLNQRVLRYDASGAYIQQVNVELNADTPPAPLLDPVAIGVFDSLAIVADAGRGEVIHYVRRP
jgi:hypothetical protein